MIKLKNVFSGYNGVTKLDNISLYIPDNRFVAVIGVNGSGKSTLLRTLANLLSFDGNIEYDNQKLVKMERNIRAKHISFLPQARDAPNITVQALIEHGRHPYLGFTKKMNSTDYLLVNQVAEQMGVQALLHRFVNTLSGGERQRVYLAMLLAQDCKYVLLDEPTTYLDINAQIEVMNLIRFMHELGKTVIVAMHDLQQAFTYAQDICILNTGKLVCYNTPDSIETKDAISSIYGLSIKKNDEPHALMQYSLFFNK